MKRIFQTLMIFSLALISFTACQKESTGFDITGQWIDEQAAYQYQFNADGTMCAAELGCPVECGDVWSQTSPNEVVLENKIVPRTWIIDGCENLIKVTERTDTGGRIVVRTLYLIRAD